jgi:hypothetical protein
MRQSPCFPRLNATERVGIEKVHESLCASVSLGLITPPAQTVYALFSATMYVNRNVVLVLSAVKKNW